ncbi:MAG: 3'(2'),5'-bisphosphate nucleotidase CysQ [Chloroflexi bacterium]|nr:3'(2'),5'-bisphosphate nucleotidase CysQ [Chloroflexota bacterium]
MTISTLRHIEAIVREAGAIVRVHHDRPDQIDWKGANDPVTAADQAVNDFLVAALREAFPDDAILAEESRDDRSRLNHARVWCVDPLDGTKEFIARNGEFSIMVGLAVEGRARLGVVYQPVADMMYSGVVGEGAWLTDGEGRRSLRVSDVAEPASMRLVVSRSHRNPLLDQIKAALGLTRERISGSVGLKCGLIARREADLYLHPAPGIKEWDSCAPEAILRAAGGQMTDCWGRALRYNKEDVVQHGGLVASNGRCHPLIIDLMAPVLSHAGIDPVAGW